MTAAFHCDFFFFYKLLLFVPVKKIKINVASPPNCPDGLAPLSQNQIHSNQLRRAEQEARCLQDSVQTLTTQNKDLHVQLQEIKRRQAEIECKVRSRSAVNPEACVDR